MSDLQKIWQGVIRGDRMSQKRIYEHTCGDLINVCKRYLPQGTAHLDAIQEAYIKIFTKCSSYNPDKGSLGGWMARIAVNECLHVLRKENKLVLLDVVKTDLEPVSEDDVLSRISAEEIYREVEKLSVGYRTVFNLYIVEGYNHNEIGEILNISPSSSRSQLARAKAILKKVIKKKTNLICHEAIR